MVLLGREVTGAEAHGAGLVHELADDPAARAREVAATLVERGPLALEYAKEAVRRGSELPLHDALRLEADFNHLLAGSRDRAEGLAAFFDKRPPRFEGR
jgi:enoyl-CoA hydratase/carnithine racemase